MKLQIVTSLRNGTSTTSKETLPHLFTIPKGMDGRGDLIQNEIENVVRATIRNVDGIDTVTVNVVGKLYPFTMAGEEDTRRVVMFSPELNYWEWEDDFLDYFHE